MLLQLHGFCDASENAYGGVIYLRMVDISDRVHIALVISKSKVAPIKKLTIPRLEPCGAHLLSQLLHHVKFLFKDIYAWTDSTIVLSWWIGNPRRFKIYVSNESLLSSSTFHKIIGTMLIVWKIQLTMYLEDFFPHNCWIVEYGGKNLLGSNFLHFNGLNNRDSPLLTLTKKEKCVISLSLLQRLL